MTSDLRVLVELGPKGKRWVAVAADWPGLERNGRDEAQALEKLRAYVPRYAPVAERAGLGAEFAAATDLSVIERYTGTGSTDFWGISFAPSDQDRAPTGDATFGRQLTLLRAAWAHFDTIAGRVSAELRPGPRGGGRDRDRIVRHVWGTEGSDFAKRVKVPAELGEMLTPAGLAIHRDRFVEAMHAWRAEGRALGNWTIPYLLRHAAYHVLDHAWEMEDRDLTGEMLRHDGRIDEAEAEYRESIRGWQRSGNRGAVANQLESFAFVAVARGDGVRATRLLGAAEALRDLADARMTPHERVEYDTEIVRLRQELGEDAFESAWAEGRRMVADEAVALRSSSRPISRSCRPR